MAAVHPGGDSADAGSSTPRIKGPVHHGSNFWQRVVMVLGPALGVLFLFIPKPDSTSNIESTMVHEVVTNAVLVILTALVVISLTFEFIQETLENSLEPVFKPVLNALNQELMGLGFLAVIMYFVIQFKVLIKIGEATLCKTCNPCQSLKSTYALSDLHKSTYPGTAAEQNAVHSRLLGSGGTCDPCGAKDTLTHPVVGFHGATEKTKYIKCGARRLFETRDEMHARMWGAEAWATHRNLGGAYTGQCLEVHCNEALLHLFEDIHMCLFLVLLLFFARAVLLLKQVNATADDWQRYEAMCREPGGEDKIVQKYNVAMTSAASGAEEARLALEFMLLRKRFMDGNPGDPDDDLDADFSFAEYMEMCASEVATEVVEIPPLEWVFMEVFFIFVWACMQAPIYLRTRIFLAYTLVIFIMQAQLMGKLDWVLHQVTLPYPKVTKGAVAPEGAPAIGSGSVPFMKSQWAKKRMLAAKAKQAAAAHGGHGHGGHGHGHAKHINAQDTLFWANDPEMFLHGVRFVLLVCLVFFVMGGLALDFALKHKKEDFGIVIPVLAPIPFVLWCVYNIPKQLVRKFALATSVELLKNPRNIKRTMRAAQLRKSLRAIKLLRSLQNSAAAEEAKTSAADGNAPKELTDAEKRNKSELQDVFKVFDVSGDGEVDNSELGGLMQALGINLEPEEGTQLMKEFDEDNSGSISFEEFWQYMRRRQAPADPKKLVEDIFRFIDADGSGEVTADEFKDVIKGLGTGMSDEEILGLVKEIDTTGDGSISLGEFTEVLERYT